MRYLIFKTHTFFQSKLITATLLLIVFTVAAFAQGKGSSVLIVNRVPETNTERSALAAYLENMIVEELQKQFPCVDWMDTKSIGALLGWEKMRQLLGGEDNPQFYETLAGSLDTRYIITVNAEALPNGNIAAFTSIMDSQTGKVLSRRAMNPASGNALITNADAVVKQVMQDLAGIFKNICEPHWTGTLTYSSKQEINVTKNDGGMPGAMERDVKLTVSYSDKMENKIEVFLQPNSLGTEGNKTMARVTHTFDYNYLRTAERSSTIRCRPPNQQSFEKQTSGNSKEIITEFGIKTEAFPVSININQSTGRYEISVDFPAVESKRTEESSGVRSGCQEESFSESKSGEGSPMYEAFREAGFIKLSGQLDPQNSDVLSGSEIIGDLESGLYTKTWNLRYVRPKKRK